MTPDIKIRVASPVDLDGIMEVETACFKIDSFSRKQIAYLITRAKGVFLIAVYDGRIGGYLSFTKSKRHNTGRIYSIAVASWCRGIGLGGLLVDEALKYARQERLGGVFLEVRTDNVNAISLYERKGFSRRFIRPDYYDDGSAAYSMVLYL